MGCLKKIFKIIAYTLLGIMIFFFGLFVLFVVINNFIADDNTSYDQDDQDQELTLADFDELITNDTVTFQKDENAEIIQYAHHRLKWKDYNKKGYSGDVYIKQSSYEKAYKNRNGIENETNDGVSFSEHKRKHRALFKNDYYTFYWSWVYLNLSQHDKDINDIYTLFDTLQMDNQLNSVQFANILVSAIQYIPYTLIHSKSCQKLLENSGDNCQSYSCLYHENNFNNDLANGRSCFANTEFGLQSPVEFLYNLKGDCDTRSVLAYTLFKHYGYDAVVLLSKEYGHSVLGLALPANGDFVRFKGKKYYFWEMTAKRWELGQAPPDYNVMAYWHVAAG